MVFAKFDNDDMAGAQIPLIDRPAAARTMTLAHLSDPHIACMEDIAVRDFVSKRLFGYLRWKLHRGAEHGSGVLSALQTDLTRTEPDHIAVTGDLTHLGLPAEFKKAQQWLQSLGSPAQVTVIPGNHDAYVKLTWHQNMARWTEYMLSDAAREDDRGAEHTATIFPSLRTRGGIAIIGVNTARPSAPHLAIGSVGAGQLRNLADILAQTARQRLYRVLLVHHPPLSGTVSWRKRLTDAADLRSLLVEYGAELILHGHAHRTLRNYLPTPNGNIPVMGVPSISALSRTPERRARYYIYRITPDQEGWNVRLEVRIYSPEENCFIRESEEAFGQE